MEVVCRVVRALVANRELYTRAGETYKWAPDHLKAWPIEMQYTPDYLDKKLTDEFYVPYTESVLYEPDYSTFAGDLATGSIEENEPVINFKLRLKDSSVELDFFIPVDWINLSVASIIVAESIRLETKIKRAQQP